MDQSRQDIWNTAGLLFQEECLHGHYERTDCVWGGQDLHLMTFNNTSQQLEGISMRKGTETIHSVCHKHKKPQSRSETWQRYTWSSSLKLIIFWKTPPIVLFINYHILKHWLFILMKQTFIEYLLHSRHCVGYIKMNMIECLPSESGQCLRYLVYIYTHTHPHIYVLLVGIFLRWVYCQESCLSLDFILSKRIDSFLFCVKSLQLDSSSTAILIPTGRNDDSDDDGDGDEEKDDFHAVRQRPIAWGPCSSHPCANLLES